MGDTLGASSLHLYSSPSYTPSFAQIPTPTPTHDRDSALGGFSPSELEQPTPIPYTMPPPIHCFPTPPTLPSLNLQEPSMARLRGLGERFRAPHVAPREAVPGPSYGPWEFAPKGPMHGPLADPSQARSLPPVSGAPTHWREPDPLSLMTQSILLRNIPGPGAEASSMPFRHPLSQEQLPLPISCSFAPPKLSYPPLCSSRPPPPSSLCNSR